MDDDDEADDDDAWERDRDREAVWYISEEDLWEDRQMRGLSE